MAQLSNRYPSLEGKGVFISGGGSGIGAAMVSHFVAQGAKVAFIDIDVAASEALCAELKQRHGQAPWFQPCDVRDIAALQQAIQAAHAALGNLQVLINNAAKDDRHRLDELTPEYWDNCLQLNLRHQVFAAQQAARVMTEGGSIINLGSISWMRGRPGMVGYTTSKGGIHALTRTLARELGPQGIRVNAVVPGAILTPRQQALWLTPELNQEFIDLQSLKFRLQAEEVVAMVLFLASDDSRGCAGQSFIVDGGLV
ncbi:SDR family NAD(P)-dependent oxidoreductase [Balneatrix alpica]|uniref:SDR family NAD(P)-dependent oxidoreductase n=1 Tax=Balneatrix alpica TaxID=75684 RepID=UPI0027388CF7|nr:SDR family oxidoreductase [Balneatrix alpica]